MLKTLTSSLDFLLLIAIFLQARFEEMLQGKAVSVDQSQKPTGTQIFSSVYHDLQEVRQVILSPPPSPPLCVGFVSF
jgi:hypothetical protein